MLIDESHLKKLIDDSIQDLVDRTVKNLENLMSDREWLQKIEDNVQGTLVDRTCRLINDVDIDAVVAAEVQANLESWHDQNLLQLKRLIDDSIQDLINRTIENLVNDQAWLLKIERSIETNLVIRTGELISDVDLSAAVASEVRANFDRWRTQLETEVLGRGVKDTASSPELVITDGSVVVQGGLGCGHMLVETDLATRNLVVTGTVNTDCASWNELADTVADRARQLLGDQWRQEMCQQVLTLAKTNGIDFQDITLGGKPLVMEKTLNPKITDTSIEKLGTLRNLTVLGAANLSRTLVARDGRVGINTESPDMALTIWDEEVSVSMGKHSRDRAWIGSSRNHALDMGVNRKRAISIEPDGLVVVDRLRVDRWRISFGNSVPNHSGTRGDLVFNHDPKPGSPWAWQCLGAFQWQSLGTT